MQDARLRLLSVFLLSAAAFLNVIAALFVILWWTLFTKRKNSIPSRKAFCVFLLLIALVSVLMELRGLLGVSYFTRMTAVLLIANWAYTEIKPSDMLNTMTWLFGQKFGFELGLISAVALFKITVISEDFANIKAAYIIKGSKLKISDYISAAGNILIMSLRDASKQGRILALRGYKNGGSLSPSFKRSKTDLIPVFFSTGIFSYSFLSLVTYL